MVSKVSFQDIMSWNLEERLEFSSRENLESFCCAMGFGQSPWPNADLYLWFPAHLPPGRESQSLRSSQGNWPFPLPYPHLDSTWGRTLYTPGWKAEPRGHCGRCPEPWWGDGNAVDEGVSVCLFHMLLVPAWPHTFLRSPSWTWQSVNSDWGWSGQTSHVTPVSILCSNLFYPMPLKRPSSFCRDAPKHGKHTPSWMSCSFCFGRDLIVMETLIVPRLCPEEALSLLPFRSVCFLEPHWGSLTFLPCDWSLELLDEDVQDHRAIFHSWAQGRWSLSAHHALFLSMWGRGLPILG